MLPIFRQLLQIVVPFDDPRESTSNKEHIVKSRQSNQAVVAAKFTFGTAGILVFVLTAQAVPFAISNSVVRIIPQTTAPAFSTPLALRESLGPTP